MPRSSLRVAAKYQEKVKLSLKRHGFPTQQYLAVSLGIARSTVSNFLNGKPVDNANFLEICEKLGLDWQEIADFEEQECQVYTPIDQQERNQINNQRVAFFAYDDCWANRGDLVTQLSAKIQRDCRILILTGITGIGKTALAECLAVELQAIWDQFYRINFDDKERVTDFASVAVELLTSWQETVTPEERKDPAVLLQKLVKCWRSHRYLLLIDSVELILKGNEEEGWSEFEDEYWAKFLEKLLTAEYCQSRLLLTSQDLPKQLAEVGARYPNFWYCQPLSGLTTTEQLELFQKTNLEVNTNSVVKSYLLRIGQAYEGHPLALRVIAGEISSKPFNGNVIAYWHKYGQEIEEVEKALEEAKTQVVSAEDRWQLDRYTRSLKWQVRSRLDKTLNRLKQEVYYAYVLICAASVYRCPVKESWWLSHLEDWNLPETWDDNQSQQMLDTLRDRYLVEEEITNNQLLLRQHNLIRSVALDHLKELTKNYEH